MNAPNDPTFGAESSAENDSETLNAGTPKVSAAPGKIFIIIGLLVAFVLLVLWLLKDDEAPRGPAETKDENITIADQSVAPAPPPPQPPEPLPPPRPPAPPPIDLAPPPLPAPVIDSGSAPDNEARQARLRSEMLVVSGRSGSARSASNQDGGGISDPNLGFASRAFRATEAETAKAGNLGNLNLVIGQGKIIQAVLESALNTQLPGDIRAIVSRDVYAESGKNVLIPKGSRLLGTYNTNLLQGQDRIYVIWSRIIRPDGIDVFVNSPGYDNLGRPGLEGHLDNRFQQIFAGSILTSIVSLSVAFASEEFLDAGETTSTTNTDGSSTNTSSPTSTAAIQATQDISNVGRRIVDKIIDTRPLVTVDQGTQVNVILNRDLVFPPEAVVGAARMVP